jgi:hypothetical protein
MTSLLSLIGDEVVVSKFGIEDEMQDQEYDDNADDLERARGVPAWIEWTTICFRSTGDLR